MNDDTLKIQVDVDFHNFDSVALEITKSFLGSQPKIISPREYTGAFLMAYSCILTELEKIRQNKKLSTNIVKKSTEMDFSKFEKHNED